ncbi:hypothetical protein MTR67_043304 [Solanum verrucosum]|uniref:NB-ARC domain-containing protein n=1 Tax=Solanum verrucosum TaxID=315347 RepID=A0AAF0URH4_SOLVR|nr:hypothetical protein MTR67_043304 [Solanum verrucosum]
MRRVNSKNAHWKLPFLPDRVYENGHNFFVRTPNEVKRMWDEFIDTLRGVNTSRGNCILVMTRMKLVASTLVAVGPHMLERLENDHCWLIFKQRAFVYGEDPEEIVSMKNMIVEMCQGLPLAAGVLGGLLCNKEKHEWWAIIDGTPLLLVKMIMERIA